MCSVTTTAIRLAAVAAAAFAGDHELGLAEVVSLAARPFAPGEVRLLDGPFRAAQERNRAVLLAIEPDRLLHMFRVTAGLPSSAAPTPAGRRRAVRYAATPSATT